MKQNLLSAKQVEEILRSGDFRVHHDGMGLMLVGSKAFRTFSWKQRLYMGTVTGKPRDVGLGSAREVSLAQARKKGRALRELARDGIDPLETKRKALAEARAEASSRVTLGVAMHDFIEIHDRTWKNDRHRKQWRGTLADYAPGLRSVPVSEVTPAVLNEALMPASSRAPETARRVRERITRVIKWINDGRPSPTVGGNGSARHHAALAYIALPALVLELRARDATSARCLEFAILTCARTAEALGARWDEIDLDDKVWVIPGARMKSGREHTVPLSGRVFEILRSMPRTSDVIFPGPRGTKMNDIAMLQQLKRTPGGENATTHGMRSAFRDWAGDQTNFPRDVVEHALAHAVGSKTETAYRRGSAIQKRRALMEAWAQYCDRPVEDAKVVKLHG
jgi:integrase